VNGVASCRYNQLITLWNKAGLFAKDAKVGILAADDGTGQGAYVANKVYGPALKKLKIPYEVASYHQTTSSADLSNTTVTWSAAILKFKSDGVNTVIFTPGGATGSVFPSIANGQAFYPAYGLTTSDALNIAGTIGAAGLKTKAIAVSWAITDLPLQAQQALPTNSAITDCAKWTAPSPTTVTGVSGYCDFVNILQASLGKAKDVKPATLRKGIDALGTKFKASVTYNGDLQFGAKVNGGNVSEVQMLQFDPATKTFGQIPGTKPVPLAGT
jgi:hypothetical protein